MILNLHTQKNIQKPSDDLKLKNQHTNQQEHIILLTSFPCFRSTIKQ